MPWSSLTRRLRLRRRPRRACKIAPKRAAWFGLALAVSVAASAGPSVAEAEPAKAGEAIPGVAPERGPATVSPRAAALFRLAMNGQAGPAQTAALRAAQPVQADVLTWSRLALRDEGDWREIRDFLKRRPDWPRADLLRARAEETLPESLSGSEVLSFFADTPPRTARGARLFGEALIASGRSSEGERLIVSAWRTLPASPSEEELFLAKHRALLDPHHAARLETLLWRDRLNDARRAARLVTAEARDWAETWIALVRGRGDVDRMLDRLSKRRLRHPGLALARLRWRRGRKRYEDAEALLLQATTKETVGEPGPWADHRLYFSREAFEEGRYDVAYRLAGPHGLDAGIDYARLEWFAGWIALRRLDLPDRALARFEKMFASVSTPISRARAAYWAGEAAAALGDAAKAERWREKAAAHPNTFYGQLAARRLGRPLEAGDRDVPIADPETFSAADRDLVAAARLLYRAREIRAARLFLKETARRRLDEPTLRYLAAVARAEGDAGGEIAVADLGQAPARKLWPELYPNPARPSFEGRRTEAALLLAIARQESRFTPDALSSAGARGLMQMMPRTARTTARRAGLPFGLRKLSDDADYNLTLSDAHIQALLRDYNGSYLLTAAAYNAGGGNVGKWLKRFGDPRDPDVDSVDWIESIPFSETRNYVQRVLEAVQVYRARLSGGSTPIRAPHELRP